MKELSSHIKEEIKIHAPKQYEKQKAFIGSFQPQPGQTIWQINLRTQEISKAEFTEEFANIGGSITRTIVTKELHWYCCALNEQNAFRKFNKIAKSIIESKTNQQ